MSDFVNNFRAGRRLRKAISAAARRLAFDRDLWSGETTRKASELVAAGRAALRRKNPREIAALAAGFEAEFASVIPPRNRFAVTMCDWLDVFAVVAAVAFGIHGLFFQPFIIPTGSMQPTLFGIHFVEASSRWCYPKAGCPAICNSLAFSASRAAPSVER